MKMIPYSRDPFARITYVKERVFVSNEETCAWCGQRKQDKKGTYLFRYGEEPDSISGKVNWQKELFCSVECMRTYNS
jgi:hypothetical protein